MKKSILIVLTVSLLTTLGFSQKGEKLSKEEKEEMRTYYEEKVYPVKKEAHDQFLGGLNAEDQAFLVTKREEQKSIQKENRAIQKDLKAQKEAGKSAEEMKAARKTAMAPVREKQKALTASMKPFMERNKELIETSIAPIKDNKEMWKDDKDAMRGEEGNERAAKKTKKPKKTEQSGAKTDKGAEKKKLSFVLWDGEMKKSAPKKKGTKEKKAQRG